MMGCCEEKGREKMEPGKERGNRKEQFVNIILFFI